MTRIFHLMAVALLAAGLGHGAGAQIASFALMDVAPKSPVPGIVTVDTVVRAGQDYRVTLTVHSDTLFADLDQIGRAQGNIGSNTSRLYWVGPTRGSHVAGRTTFVTTRARFEHWAIIKLLFDTVKTKTIQETKTVTISVVPTWSPPRTLSLAYRIENIANFPDDLERRLQHLGVSFGGRTTVTIADEALFEALNIRVHDIKPRLIADGRGLALNIDVSLNRAAALRAVPGVSVASPDLGRLVRSTFGKVFGW